MTILRKFPWPLFQIPVPGHISLDYFVDIYDDSRIPYLSGSYFNFFSLICKQWSSVEFSIESRVNSPGMKPYNLLTWSLFLFKISRVKNCFD